MSQKGPSTLRVLRCEHDDNGKLAYLVARNRGQAADHPVHPAVPESRYLKAVFARVTRGEPR